MPKAATHLRLIESSDRALLDALAAARPAGSRVDPSDLRHTQENYVDMILDVGYSYPAPTAHGTAFRAIDLRGRLMWLLRSPLVRVSFLSHCETLSDAIAELRVASERRAAVAREWPRVQSIIDAVADGRLDFPCGMDDAVDAGLCPVAIEAYMKTRGIPPETQVPAAQLAGRIEKEPLLAFALYAAWQRNGSPFPPPKG